MGRGRLKAAIIALALACLVTFGTPAALAATPASFSGASSAVQQAFVAVKKAGNDGGNVSSLVAELNGALALIQKAESENSSNPAQAGADLQSALAMAQGVQAEAPAVAQQGASARQFQFILSVTVSAVIVGVAVALYVYGDRLYRRVWLRIYGGSVVSRVG